LAITLKLLLLQLMPWVDGPVSFPEGFDSVTADDNEADLYSLAIQQFVTIFQGIIEVRTLPPCS
jgi:hypothetical protein